MTLTPLDIEHATFERALFGYRAGAVRALLERVAAERERSLRELRHLRDEIVERDEQIAQLREAEAELQRAVIAAERIATEMKDNAREAARLIEAEARARAEAIRREADAEVAAAHAELARLEHSQAIVREQLRGQLTGFLRALDPAAGPRDPVAGARGPNRHDDLADGAWAIGEEDLPG
ncbi:MAG: DivIVA domain-containing protein [Trueperaceae bacterium]